MNTKDVSKMNLTPLKVSGDDASATGSILICCMETNERKAWNDAARSGWVADLNGPAYKAYYSPEGIARIKAAP